MQTLVEIGPSNASQGQHRRMDVTEQMKNLTLVRTRTQVLGFSSADSLPTKLRVPVGTLSNEMSRIKVHMKGRQWGEFKI